MRTIVLLISILCMSYTNQSYESWIVEDSLEYNGNYLFFDFSKYSGNKYLIQEITISTEKDSLIVLYQKYFNTDSPEDFIKIEIQLPLIENYILSASNWKAVFGKELEGEFVRKYPPANAKGPVLKGLVFGDMFFEKVE